MMEHINTRIIDSDRMSAKNLIFPCPGKGVEFIQIYDFLWDRMREMIKDITRLSEKERNNKNVVDMCEQIARFFILAINEVFKLIIYREQRTTKPNRILTPK